MRVRSKHTTGMHGWQVIFTYERLISCAGLRDDPTLQLSVWASVCEALHTHGPPALSHLSHSISESESCSFDGASNLALGVAMVLNSFMVRGPGGAHEALVLTNALRMNVQGDTQRSLTLLTSSLTAFQAVEVSSVDGPYCCALNFSRSLGLAIAAAVPQRRLGEVIPSLATVTAWLRDTLSAGIASTSQVSNQPASHQRQGASADVRPCVSTLLCCSLLESLLPHLQQGGLPHSGLHPVISELTAGLTAAMSAATRLEELAARGSLSAQLFQLAAGHCFARLQRYPSTAALLVLQLPGDNPAVPRLAVFALRLLLGPALPLGQLTLAATAGVSPEACHAWLQRHAQVSRVCSSCPSS